MKILVTGCAGFIGFHLTKRLIEAGHTIVGVDNLNDYYSPELKLSRLEELGIDTSEIEYKKPVIKDRFIFIQDDIESLDLYQNNLNDRHFDLICHLAAQAGVRYSIDHPQEYINSNIQGFFNILEYCRRNPVKRLVFASSSSVYGKNDKVPYCESDTTEKPMSLYAATKKADELFAYSYAELYGIQAIGLRFFTVYGPWGRPDMAPFIFTRSIIEGTPLKVFNNGDMARDFTYIDDIIEGVYRVLFNDPATQSKEKYRIYNIGHSAPINLGDFISIIERIVGKEADKIMKPMQPGDVKVTYADTSLLQRDYGYSPSTSIESGLKELVEWYREYHKI